MKRTSTKRRTALSLVEMLVVMTLGSVVMGGLVVGMTALLRMDARIQESSRYERMAGLSMALRTDLRAAASAKWDPKTGRLALALQGEDVGVEYRFTTGHAVRVEGDTRLRFRLPPDAQVACEPLQAESPAVLQVQFTTPGGPPAEVAVGLGRNARLLYRERGEP